MSNIFKTAEVRRLATPLDELQLLVFRAVNQGMDHADKDDPDSILANVVNEIALLMQQREAVIWSQLWDEAHDIPQFDPDIEPKDCYHCRTMVKLRGELCYGHLKHHGILD
jgi:hypothetical protein